MGELNQLWSERYTISEESMSENERSFLVIFILHSLFVILLGPCKAVTLTFSMKAVRGKL